MGKGSKRRPAVVPDRELSDRWAQTFGEGPKPEPPPPPPSPCPEGFPQ